MCNIAIRMYHICDYEATIEYLLFNACRKVMRLGMDVGLHVSILNFLDLNYLRYHLGVWLERRVEVGLG